MIIYRNLKSYKYELLEDYVVDIDIHPPKDICLEFISMTIEGHLITRKGYAWDGPSGPAIDTKNFMQGSLTHDVLCQLMRMGLLPMTCKDAADRLLEKTFVESSRLQKDTWWQRCEFRQWLCKIRSKWIYEGVHLFGAGSSKLTGEKEVEILTAP